MGSYVLPVRAKKLTMKVFAFLATVALVSARSAVVKIDQIEYGFCPDSPQPGTIDSIDVQPFPISLVEGSTLPIPCLEIPDSETGEILHIGSCQYDADYLLAKFSDFLCPDHVPEGQACATPLMPGVYGGGEPIQVEIPAIPDILAELLASGTYYLGATVDKPDGMMACLYVRVEVVA